MRRAGIIGMLLFVAHFAVAGGNVGDGMIPFVAVTGKPTEMEIRAKVAAIHAQRMESFCIYARSGLELEYMGEEWLKVCEWFCDEAERRGMKVWLYDEYNWPSGSCKGRVTKENESWRYQEYGVFRNPDGTFHWTSAIGKWDRPNVYESAAVARFVELTHDVYAKRLSRWFANKTIVGIFADEPGTCDIVRFPEGEPLVAFRKYSGLEEEYRAVAGRSFRKDVEKWLETREGDVWSVCTDLAGKRFRSAYFDQIRAWCDRHGILFTGHLMSENDIYASVSDNGNPVSALRGMSLPGMDEIRTVFDIDAVPRPIEWLTYNLARQAILYRGNGGLAELYACGPANHVPATLRTVMWLCAFHGIDHYVTCMDAMDMRGLLEKHCYLSCTGPIQPWYERHARVLAAEARIAAEWARKTVAEREVAVRYPNHAAARLARAGRTDDIPGPDINGLLRELELNQFTCRLVDEDETTDLPLVFSCRESGRFDEERTGKKGLTAECVVKLCRERLPAGFVVLEQNGAPARDLLVRTFTDGSSAVLNLQGVSARTLVAVRGGKRTVFELPGRGVARFAAGALPDAPPRPSAVQSLAEVKWNLSLDVPNIRRVNFDAMKNGSLKVADSLKDVRLATREFTRSYAITPWGWAVELDQQVPGVEIIRNIASPYAFEMDGTRVDASEPCTSLRPGYNPLYRQTKPFDLAAGTHRLTIASGEADRNFYLPALFVIGDFAVFNGVLMPRPQKPVGFGSLSGLGLGDFTGTATWSAEVSMPAASRVRLRLSTGGRVTQVKLAGRDLGVRAWAPFEWELPPDCAGRKGTLEISVSTSVMPMYGDHSAGKWDSEPYHSVCGPDGPCGLLDAAWVLGDDPIASEAHL